MNVHLSVLSPQQSDNLLTVSHHMAFWIIYSSTNPETDESKYAKKIIKMSFFFVAFFTNPQQMQYGQSISWRQKNQCTNQFKKMQTAHFLSECVANNTRIGRHILATDTLVWTLIKLEKKSSMSVNSRIPQSCQFIVQSRAGLHLHVLAGSANCFTLLATWL